MTAVQRGHGNERHLMPSGSHDRPAILVTEELVRDSLGMNQIFNVSALATQNAEDRLNEEGRRHQLAIQKMRQRIEVAGVVALEFELRAVPPAQFLQDRLDILEGVLEDPVAGRFQMRGLPLMLKLGIAL